MSLSAAALQLLLDKGLTLADAIELAGVIEEGMAAPVPELSKGALRTRKWRENKARDVTVTSPETRHGDVSHVGERAQVVTPSLPSLRSEEVKTPTEPNGSVAPKGAKTRGSKRVPSAWSPSLSTIAALDAEGHTAGDLERALTRMRDHEFRSPRTDWDAAFRNWVRTDLSPRKAPHERPRTDHRLDAFRDKLLDVATAMDAAFEQPRRQHGD